MPRIKINHNNIDSNTVVNSSSIIVVMIIIRSPKLEEMRS